MTPALPAPDPIRILSMDGGPGPLFQLRLLQRIELQNPGFLKRTHVFAGTSDGALMAMFLAKRLGEGASGEKALRECLAFSREYSEAFSQGTSRRRFVLGHGPYSDGVAFRTALARGFGETTLNDLHTSGRYVAVATFNSSRWRPRFFRNFGPDWSVNGTDGGFTLLEVALNTSSVPGVMPLHVNGGFPYLDGFLSANNPAMSALSVVVRDVVRRSHPREDPFNHVVLLSLGVGQTAREGRLERRTDPVPDAALLLTDERRLRDAADQPSLAASVRFLLGGPRAPATIPRAGMEGPALNWGVLDLVFGVPYLVDMVMHGQSAEINHQCARLLGTSRFHRYEPQIALMRAVARFLTRRGRGSKEAMELLESQCFPDTETVDAGTPEAGVNRYRTVNTLAWIQKSWMSDPPAMGGDTPDDGTRDEGFF